MNTVKVRRVDLLAKVRANREAHRAIFEKAIEGYRRAAVVELESMLAEARAGKRIRRAVDLVQPQDQSRDYDRAVTMLEMSVDDDIQLSAQEFAQYVMDDWAWKAQFTTTSQMYLNQ